MLLHKSVEFDSRVRREAAALAASGHDVCVVELAPVPAGEATLDGFRRRSCLPPLWMRRRLPFRLYRIVFLFSFVRAAVRTAPQIVHAHDAAMLLPGIAAARITGAQLVYDSHELATGVPYRERLWAFLVGALERAIVPRCSAVITVSGGIAARMRDRYELARLPTVVRNVSALTRSGEGGLRRRLGLDDATPLVLHQGAPAAARGCDVLLDAVALMPGVHLVFLGDPEAGEGERLASAIARRGLASRVATVPSVPLVDLLANTAEADVGVTLLQDSCENHRLALPNKLFEYIAAGVPVVAGALPEVKNLIDSYAIGWCVAPDDPAAVAAALTRALQARGDPALRERLQRARAELSWSREQARLLELYDRLANGSS